MENIVEPDRPPMKIWRMHTAYWIPKATNTHSEYVILLFFCNNGNTNAHHCYIVRTLFCLKQGCMGLGCLASREFECEVVNNLFLHHFSDLGT